VTENLGRATYEEILSQPDDWARLTDELRRGRSPFRDVSQVVLIGCGSQYYIGLSVAWLLRAVLGVRAEAVPASEFLAFPEVHRPARKRSLAVFVSRSGKTSEVVEACQRARQMGVRTLFLGAVEDSPLRSLSQQSVVFPYLDEKGICTTKATSGFLLALLWWCLEAAGRGKGRAVLAGLAEAGRRVLPQVQEVTNALAGAFTPRAIAFLGSGPLYGIAREGSLKSNEMALIPTAAFHSLEYRHGPRSLVARDILVTGLVSREQEMVLLSEVQALGGRALALCGAARPGSVEWRVDVDAGLEPFARLPLYLVGVQMLGLALSRARGLNADAPRHLSRYVDLTQPEGGGRR